MISLMQHLNWDTFPKACSVKFAKVTYININKRNVYHDYIFVSTVLHIQLSLKTLNKFRYLRIFVFF